MATIQDGGNVPSNRLKYASTSVRNSILSFIRNIVPKKVKKAIEIILQPCCDVEITAVAKCTGTYTYDVTITLNKPISMVGSGIFFVSLQQYIVKFDEATLSESIGSWVDGATTLTLTNVHIDADPPAILGIPPGTYSVGLAIYLPMGSAAGGIDTFSPGVYIQSLAENVVFDNSSCGS